MSEIEFQIDSHNIGILTVNRPHVHNALNWTAMHAFADAVEQAHEAAETVGRGLRAFIITGAGPSFVSGGDINELQAYPSRADGLRLATLMGDALARLEALPCITIAAINGPARGGGAEIAVACDLRVMDEVADIGFVQAKMGIATAWGGGQRLLRAIGYARALELLATGRVISAAEAFGLRLVNLVTAAGEACDCARHLAEQIAANPPAATQAAKRILRLSQAHTEDLAIEAERGEFPALWDTEYRREAVRKFLNRGK
jgi:enoyl-CoA hydratase